MSVPFQDEIDWPKLSFKASLLAAWNTLDLLVLSEIDAAKLTGGSSGIREYIIGLRVWDVGFRVSRELGFI